jgi:hypothetical protein
MLRLAIHCGISSASAAMLPTTRDPHEHDRARTDDRRPIQHKRVIPDTPTATI